MKKIFLILLLVFFSISSVEAVILWNYQVLRIFDLSNNDINVKYIPYNNIKKLGYTILANSIKGWDRYSQIYILWVNKNFNTIFWKDISVEYIWINWIWNVLSTVDMKVFAKDINKDKKIYKGQISYEALKNGINYISICAKYNINSIWKYTNLRCEKNPNIFYYIKEYNKIVSKEEYLSYLEKFNKQQELKRQQELKYIKNINKYFDENKIKKSRFGNNTKIKTSKDLEKLLFNFYKNSSTPVTLKNLDKVVDNVANKYYIYDDNNKAFSSFSWFKTYVKYLFKKFIYENKLATIKRTNQDVSNNNFNQELEDFKIKNANDRKKAIDFSKKLLKVLEKYKSKKQKLEKLQYIKNIINTQYTPEKFKNQNLIWYVKDYLDIVEYAINLQ